MENRRTSFGYDELLACARGELFGAGNAQLPLPPMLMFDRISEIAEAGGEYGKGLVRAVLELKPDLWFFPCHFKGDPVMPGCLGLDALWQLLGFFLGWLGAPGKPTVFLYSHHDVQPVTPLELWETPPFEPTVRGEQLFARGAADDKGQLSFHLLGVKAHLAATGRTSPAVNLKIIAEGGYTLLRDFDFFRSKQRIKADPAPYIRFAIEAKF